MNNRHEIDMSRGSLLPKLLAFSFPLMLMNMLQLTFNTVDLIVVDISRREKFPCRPSRLQRAMVTLVVVRAGGLGTGATRDGFPVTWGNGRKMHSGIGIDHCFRAVPRSTGSACSAHFCKPAS
jgi:hypothetical protein